MEISKLTARINELYHKSKNGGLTEEEKKEQTELRALYRANIVKSLGGQLDGIKIKMPDGTIKDVKKK